MKKDKIRFIKRSVVFLVVFVMLFFFVNGLYVRFVEGKKHAYRAEEIYQDYIDGLSVREVDFAFFGDSHTKVGINPKFIPGSYNFGTFAENYVKTYYKFRRVLHQDDVKINNAVFELDMHTFSTLLTDKTRLLNDLDLYSRFMSYDEIIEIKKEPILKILLQVNFPVIGSGDEFHVLMTEPKMAEMYMGWTMKDGNFSLQNKKEVAEKMHNHFFKQHERISEISFEYFMKALDLAKKNDINVIFIKYPVSEEYDQLLVENKVSRDDYYSFIFERVNFSLSDYLVLDYHDIFFDNPDYFADSDHLNHMGAELLSSRVYMDLQKNLID